METKDFSVATVDIQAHPGAQGGGPTSHDRGVRTSRGGSCGRGGGGRGRRGGRGGGGITTESFQQSPSVPLTPKTTNFTNKSPFIAQSRATNALRMRPESGALNRKSDVSTITSVFLSTEPKWLDNSKLHFHGVLCLNMYYPNYDENEFRSRGEHNASFGLPYFNKHGDQTLSADFEVDYGNKYRGEILTRSSFYVLAHYHVQVLVRLLLVFDRPDFHHLQTQYILYSLGEVYR